MSGFDVDAARAALEARHPTWVPRSLHATLEDVAGQYPDRPFVITEQGTLSYAELAGWSVRLARGLVAAGLAPGERVGLFLPNGAEMIAAWFAVARAGGVAVPISFRLRARELAALLTLSGASVLVTMEAFREVDALAALDEIAPGWDQPDGQRALPGLRVIVTVPDPGSAPRRPAAVSLSQLERGADAALDAELARLAAAARPGDMSTIFYTSGTTGVPKGVMYTYDMELRSAYGSAYARALRGRPPDHVRAAAQPLLRLHRGPARRHVRGGDGDRAGRVRPGRHAGRDRAPPGRRGAVRADDEPRPRRRGPHDGPRRDRACTR